jgi:hypothetical protein
LGEEAISVDNPNQNVSISSLESPLVHVIHGFNERESNRGSKVRTFDQGPLV